MIGGAGLGGFEVGSVGGALCTLRGSWLEELPAPVTSRPSLRTGGSLPASHAICPSVNRGEAVVVGASLVLVRDRRQGTGAGPAIKVNGGGFSGWLGAVDIVTASIQS